MEELQKIQCKLCGLNCTKRLFNKKNVSIVKCENCGLVFNDPPLNPGAVRALLNDNYYQNPDIEYGYEDYIGDKSNLIRTFAKRIKIINTIYERHSAAEAQSLAKRRLLDIGCAMGYSLPVGHQYGWDAYGVEISEVAVKLAEENLRLRIFNGELKKANFPNNFFEVVTAWDVIQAYINPLDEFYEINRILCNNGILAITVMNVDSLPARMFGESWDQYKVKETNLYFSPSTLTRLLSESGFEILQIKPIGGGKYCSLRFIINRLKSYNRIIYRISDFFIRRLYLERLSFYTNSLSSMMVLAKKIRNVN